MSSAKLYANVGPSGGGKGVLADYFREKFGFKRLVSTTSRPPREQKKANSEEMVMEQNGVDYHFLDLTHGKEEFRALIEKGHFFESKQQDEEPFHYYGKSWDEINRALATSDCFMFDINIDGFSALKARFHGQITGIFLEPEGEDMPAMLKTLEQRLLTKRRMSPAEIAGRLKTAPREIEWAHIPGNIDHIIKADPLEVVYAEAVRIIGGVMGMDRLVSMQKH